MMDTAQLNSIIALRQRLHACPEVSGQEARTRAVLAAFLAEHTTLSVRDMGGWLLAEHFEGEGLPSVGFRADTDALPVPGGADHRCGHDGHSAILCGLALLLEGRRVGKNVFLIFQGAEETGEGAKRVRDTWPGLRSLSALYALHNIPGHPFGAVLMREGCFACASCGHVVHLRGKPAHAAYPADGINPTEILCRLALQVPHMIEDILAGDERLLMRTIVGLLCGGEDFGIAAGDGRLNQTLRGHREADIRELIRRIEAEAKAQAAAAGMTCEFEIRDAFPDTTNDPALFADALNRFRQAGLQVRLLSEPMRWSEDCGWLLREVPGVYFGIGAGERCPGLHTEGYAFDDALIAPALRALEALV